MQFHNVLDKIFSQPTGIKVLRFLILYNPNMSGRELAKFCKVSHMQVYRVLTIFESYGIVTRKKIGDSFLYTINQKNVLVEIFLKPLFEKEKILITDLLTGIFNKIRKYVASCILFGSVSNAADRPDSDVDILLLAQNKRYVEPLKRELSDIEIEFYEKTGNKLSVLVLDVSDLQSMKKNNKILLTKINEGRLIFGQKLKEVL